MNNNNKNNQNRNQNNQGNFERNQTPTKQGAGQNSEKFNKGTLGSDKQSQKNLDRTNGYGKSSYNQENDYNEDNE